MPTDIDYGTRLVAEMLGTTRQTILNEIEAGRLEVEGKPRKYRVTAKALAEYLGISQQRMHASIANCRDEDSCLAQYSGYRTGRPRGSKKKRRKKKV